jgi:hypothetical protein
MVEKPKALTTIGFIQVLLAASFVIWLVFFPSSGTKFAWPITPAFSAMFIGTGFLARTYIGYSLWREKYWPRLRWQATANLAFLGVIFLATYWHIDQMNWKTNIIVAHIWILAYTVEPMMLFLLEPRTPQAKERLPEALRGGPLFAGLKNILAFGLIVSMTIASLAVINPKFLDTRWPWTLDPFDARIMAAFLALAGVWCLTGYFAEDWGEVRHAILGLVIFAVSNFILWLYILPQLDQSRPNIYTYGAAFGFFSIFLIYYYWKQERARL